MKTFSSSSPASLLGLATLALLGLTAAPAHAQTLSLNSGDNLTISGAGTVGTQNGKAVSNTTSFYSTSGGNSTVQTSGTSTLTLANGGSISTGTDYPRAGLYATGSGAISITGGSIAGGVGFVYGAAYGLLATGSSAISITGGSIVGGDQRGAAVALDGSGPITISGGTIKLIDQYGDNGNGIYAGGSSAITITGGSIIVGRGEIGLYDNGGGPITISGGTLSAGGSGTGLYSYNGNTGGGVHPITITGGTFSAGDGGYGMENITGPVSISGGTFSAGQNGTALQADSGQIGDVTISGGLFSAGPGGVGLSERYTTVNLFSFADSPFLINGVSMNNTTLDGNLYGPGTISATLANGDTLNTTFLMYNGKINLNIGTPPAAVPETSSVVSLGLLLLLGVGGIAFAARRKSAV